MVLLENKILLESAVNKYLKRITCQNGENQGYGFQENLIISGLEDSAKQGCKNHTKYI